MALDNLAQNWCFGQFYHSRIELLQNHSAFFVSLSLVRGKFEGIRENLRHKNWAIDDPNNPGNCCFKDESNPNQCLCNGNYTDNPNKSKTTMIV